MRHLLFFSLLGVFLVGCGSATSNGNTQPLAAEDQIRQIENNPNMPAEAKAAAIAQLRQGSAKGDAKASTPTGG